MRGARRAVAGQGAFVQAVRRLDTAVAEDIEHAPAVESRAGCAGERRSNAETIAVKPDDFPSSRFAGSRDDARLGRAALRRPVHGLRAGDRHRAAAGDRAGTCPAAGPVGMAAGAPPRVLPAEGDDHRSCASASRVLGSRLATSCDQDSRFGPEHRDAGVAGKRRLDNVGR